MKRALISVSDKTNLIPFANFLVEKGYEIISTGGTYTYLLDNKINAIEIKDVTGFEEILDGRVKTLHPLIHAGILYRRDDKSHVETIEKMNCESIDMVIVNLYPFFQNVNSNISFDEKIEYIDIGGPSLIRGASKNFKYSVPVIDPNDYEDIMNEINSNGSLSFEKKKYLAGKAFSYTAVYDSAISSFLLEEDFPEFYSGSFKRESTLRYGENPHQKAAFYTSLNKDGSLKDFNILQGKALSYNNIRDIDVAWKIVNEFDECACSAVKHNIPCGAAVANSPLEAYTKAYECDSTSIFGGIVAFNREVELDLAEKLSETFLEVIIAPKFSTDAREFFSKKVNLRLIEINTPKVENEIQVISVSGGLLLQSNDSKVLDKLEVVTNTSPSKEDLDDMVFGMKIAKYVKSNAILVVKDGKTIGISGGEVSRIGAAKNALNMSGGKGVLISDAFFPFDDIVTLCKEYNISSIVQPGGSIHDDASINKCNELDIPMVFTGIRHFNH
ncbi:bifunctional phosphoribosylaminoimidazolecarboxamide formyltransferase/IMP cyclohydrolase [Clostridium cylindrosporum]|uniref:Bifunctional purine biosynthesis protein PurH n=1 Tax=Clostridium cylindrosporum DSM 605 TaxID=1121307 RepID=A0A0J8G4J9_CLOCY|nr:bifunctional phosphoribosylaminoimidazolecarboxamide formyltransferase/IMP cyclohydrolase [Clostridium cylindrosporum]KMT22596.1 bifunctional purine biosynthesis protein PurH [Clostridium cylindrosporum DSM 605]